MSFFTVKFSLFCYSSTFLFWLSLSISVSLSLVQSHGANCAWQVRRCITAHSTDSGSHPSHPVSTPLLHASLICLPACLALWVSDFIFYFFQDLRLTSPLSRFSPLNCCFPWICLPDLVRWWWLDSKESKWQQKSCGLCLSFSFEVQNIY